MVIVIVEQCTHCSQSKRKFLLYKTDELIVRCIVLVGAGYHDGRTTGHW